MKRIYFTLTLLLLPLSVWGIIRLLNPVPTLVENNIRLITVRTISIREEIRGIGELVSPNEHWVISEAKGNIDSIHIRAGDMIKKGETLLTLKNPALESEYQQARFDWQQAKAEALSTKADLEIQLEQIKSDLALTKLEYDANKQLQEKQITSTLETQKLRLKVGILEKRLEHTVEASNAKLQAAQIHVEQFKEKMLAAELKHKALLVQSTITGQLLKWEKPWKKGMVINEGATVARIAEDDRLIARVRIPVISSRSLKPGLDVEIDSRQNKIKGKIIHILPTVEDDEQILEVSLPEKLPASFRPNQPIRASILLEAGTATLSLPLTNSLSGNQTVTIYKLTDEHWLEPTQVHLGRSGQKNIEVLSGLRKGDKVLLNVPDNLRGKNRILIRSEND